MRKSLSYRMKRLGLTLVGVLLCLTVTSSASAGGRNVSANPELEKAATCIRAALRKEDLAIKYIREGTLSNLTIAEKVIDPASNDISGCAQQALKTAGSLDEISPTDLTDLDGDLARAAAADHEASSSLSHHKIGAAIAFLQDGNRIKEDALTALEKAAARPPKPSPSAIYAVFLPPKLATRYSVNANLSRGAPSPTFRWTLTLEQIDPDKSSPAGFQSSDPNAPNYASAGFDPSCNNTVLANGRQISATATQAVYVWSDLSNEFTWYHGDKGAYPPSGYGCDHTKMGGRGHQGIVTVQITEGDWICTATIEGTNLNPAESTHGADPVCKYQP